MQQLMTPRGPVEFVPRDFKKWPRNSQPPAIDEAKLRGVTVHWPGGVEAKRYAGADTFAELFAIDQARVGDSIRGHNARPGLTDVGYNYFIGRSGVLFEGRGWTRNGANGALLPGIRDQYPPGTEGSNPWWVSVQVIAGTDLPDLTPAQWETLKRFYTYVVDRAGIKAPQVNGHRDVRATACPGDVVHRQLPTVAAAWPVVASKPPQPQAAAWPPFNPSIGQLGLYPLSPVKATISFGLSGGNNVQGQSIAYLRRILYAYCGWNGTGGKANLNPSANWGPWAFNGATRDGLMGVQALFGLPQDGIASHTILPGESISTWDAIDQLWEWNN